MQIGLDFDNTIACYDKAIAVLAEELFELPKDLPRTKLALRDFLITEGRELEWTAFQGELYGPGMRFAQPFEGAISTMQHLVDLGHELVIVSHRSRRPYAGTPHDLHTAAKDWVKNHLQSAGLFSDDSSIVDFFETREEKVARISELGCHVFVDDLPEVLQATGFPKRTIRVLFDPSGSKKTPVRCYCITAWPQLKKVLMG
jgi:hypothetical protein